MHEPNPIGVSATFFKVILANPGCTRARLISLGVAAGVGKPSSSSLLAQFVTRGLAKTVDSSAGLTYFAVGSEYKPGYARKTKKADKVAAPKAPAVAPQQDTSVQDLLNNMSIVKARALYDELRKIFGG